MSDLAMERRHLAESDIRISEAEDRIALFSGRLKPRGTDKSDKTDSASALEMRRAVLVTFKEARQITIDTIARLEKDPHG